MFRRDGPGWQIGKLRRHFNEWLEVVTRQDADAPNFVIPGWLPNLLNFLAWVLLIAFAAWAGLVIYRIVRNYWLEGQGIEPLPQIDRTWADLMEEGQKFYSRGDYRSACRYLYLALLQVLHDRDILPQKLSRTDAEYRQSLAHKSLAPLQDCYAVINLHEQSFFSTIVVSKQDYENCKTALNQILKQP